MVKAANHHIYKTPVKSKRMSLMNNGPLTREETLKVQVMLLLTMIMKRLIGN